MNFKSHNIFVFITLVCYFLFAGLKNGYSINPTNLNINDSLTVSSEPIHKNEKSTDLSILKTPIKNDPSKYDIKTKEGVNKSNSTKKNSFTRNKLNRSDYPCGLKQMMITDFAFLNKLKELDRPSKTYNADEFGYAYIMDKGFVELSGARNGHSLSFEGIDLNQVLGFIHTHPCGESKIGRGFGKVYKVSIPMPSPIDVNVFKRLLIRAKVNNRDLEDVFMTVISCKGIFDLKYTGDGENLKNWDMTEKTYKSYFKNTKNPAKAFKKYLDEVVNQFGNGFQLIEYVEDKNSRSYLAYRQDIINNKLHAQALFESC